MKRTGIILIVLLVFLAGCNKSADTTSIKLKVKGMHCVSCVLAVDKALKDVPGVSKVRVNAARAEATINIDIAMLDSIKLVDAVNRTGFPASIMKNE